MKTARLIIERGYSMIEKGLITLAYGKMRQRKRGWKGKYAKEMMKNALMVHAAGENCAYEFIKRIHQNHPEMLKGKISTLRWEYDFRLCKALLGVRADDWNEFDFYHKGWLYRLRCLTFERNRFFNAVINRRDSGATEILDNKALFAKQWNEFFQRKYCVYDPQNTNNFKTEFFDCFSGKRIIVKPIDKWGGIGVQVFETNQLDEAYDIIVSADSKTIIEEYIYQTGALHELNPSSLNTVRITTLVDHHGREKSTPKVVDAQLRVGKKGEFVDNSCAGGSCFYIDINTGTTLSGADFNGTSITSIIPGVPVRGFQIPRWEEAMAFCVKAHLHAPTALNLIGWDVCISDDGVYMIEGNANPAPTTLIFGTRSPWRYAKRYLNELQREAGEN